ncbi:hypothetical protein ZWY2020_050194 [Hordeum vulgare]|nr:hypothetical protein ZWY2020_050194 [Hordeum vulgare]
MKAYSLEAVEDTWRMEEELTRSVPVTITCTRPSVDMTDAAEALHVEFGIRPTDMSISPFYPEDFPVLFVKTGRHATDVVRGLCILLLVPSRTPTMDSSNPGYSGTSPLPRPNSAVGRAGACLE